MDKHPEEEENEGSEDGDGCNKNGDEEGLENIFGIKREYQIALLTEKSSDDFISMDNKDYHSEMNDHEHSEIDDEAMAYYKKKEEKKEKNKAEKRACD